MVAFGLGGNSLATINVVGVHCVWLVLGWVSLGRQINQLGI